MNKGLEEREGHLIKKGVLLGAPSNCCEKAIMPLPNFFLKNETSLSPRVSASASSSFGSTLLLPASSSFFVCLLLHSLCIFFVSLLLLLR